LHRTRRATSTSPAAINASHAVNCARASALIVTATRYGKILRDGKRVSCGETQSGRARSADELTHT